MAKTPNRRRTVRLLALLTFAGVAVGPAFGYISDRMRSIRKRHPDMTKDERGRPRGALRRNAGRLDRGSIGDNRRIAPICLIGHRDTVLTLRVRSSFDHTVNLFDRLETTIVLKLRSSWNYWPGGTR